MHGVALKYFAEVAAAGSLSAASERLFVAVSAISRQIAKLEAEVGTPLFTRMSRGMVLSEAGELLLAHARRTLLEAEAVRQDIISLKGAPSGTIRVVATDGPAHHFLPELMSAFRIRHPHARFSLHVCPRAEAVRRVAQGRGRSCGVLQRGTKPGHGGAPYDARARLRRDVPRASFGPPGVCPAARARAVSAGDGRCRVVHAQAAGAMLAVGGPAFRTGLRQQSVGRADVLRAQFGSRHAGTVSAGGARAQARRAGGAPDRSSGNGDPAAAGAHHGGRLLPGMVEEFLSHIAASLQGIADCGVAQAGRGRPPG